MRSRVPKISGLTVPPFVLLWVSQHPRSANDCSSPIGGLSRTLFVGGSALLEEVWLRDTHRAPCRQVVTGSSARQEHLIIGHMARVHHCSLVELHSAFRARVQEDTRVLLLRASRTSADSILVAHMLLRRKRLTALALQVSPPLVHHARAWPLGLPLCTAPCLSTRCARADPLGARGGVRCVNVHRALLGRGGAVVSHPHRDAVYVFAPSFGLGSVMFVCKQSEFRAGKGSPLDRWPPPA